MMLLLLLVDGTVLPFVFRSYDDYYVLPLLLLK